MTIARMMGGKPLVLQIGIWGMLAGILLALLFTLLVSLVFSIFALGVGEFQIVDALRVILFNSLIFGIITAGIPSGLVGFLTGVLLGIIFSRLVDEIPKFISGLIGLFVSIFIVLVFFLIVTSLGVLGEIAFALFFFPALVYILSSYIFSVIIYRRFFTIPNSDDEV